MIRNRGTAPGARHAGGRSAAGGRWLAAVLLLLGGAICLRPFAWVDPQTRLLWRAANALSGERYQEAERLALVVLEESPDCSPALLIAGEAAGKTQRPELAIDYLSRVSEDCPALYVRAQFYAGSRHFAQGRARAAERCFRRALVVHPQHLQANEKLALLLQIEGRTWEALPYAEALVRSGRFGRGQLLMIGGVDAIMVDDPHFIDQCLQSVPDDPLVLLGRARVDLIKNRVDQAESTLRRVVRHDPGQIEAQARLGEILVEKSDPAEFLQWQAGLLDDAQEHPHIWYIRGLWAKRNGQLKAAVRCFLEALQRHPNHSSANFQLSLALFSMERPQAAEPFAQRARELSILKALLHELRHLSDLNMMRQVTEINERLGRPLEALGWCRVALAIDPDAQWAAARLSRPIPLADGPLPLTLVSTQPALRLDVSEYPLPVWPQAVFGDADTPANDPVDGDVRLVDEAADVGLVFQYYNGTTASVGPEHIVKTTGAGIGVIDFDGDNWPDLFIAQGGPWEARGKPSTYRDRLFRNSGDGRFLDVTEQAGLGDADYSQGVAVGDYNQDGFPDIYLANIGPNRLYKNNGDGTFRDVTQEAGVAGGDRWSTSAAIVDLNGDRMPEIYVVNYAPLQEVLTRDCRQVGHPMACSPTMFHGEQDLLFQSNGDGTFRDVTETSGVVAPDGKGLGVVAAAFDGSGRIDLFVANDTTANFFFVNQTTRPGRPVSIVDQGILSGAAFREDGQAQACMGIATGDADGDGLLDLFVTNFYSDSNTLYRQLSNHMFVDNSRRAGLFQPSFDLLGFGTQFLDAELDGWPDLFLSNGHVDRQYDSGVRDLMRPQYFRNLGDGRFVELSARSLGEYFQKQFLGRCVVTLDWNRDGREDICVLHLDAPVALLTNRTENTGHYLAVKLQGVASNREAIGSVLHLTAGDRTWMRQLIAGDGYMGSCERKIIFGLGDVQQVDRLQIRWPSGAEQTFEDLAVDREVLFVEGDQRPQRQ